MNILGLRVVFGSLGWLGKFRLLDIVKDLGFWLVAVI